ncbi:hypothetical protein [Minisyncoccus archaeiphilus]
MEAALVCREMGWSWEEYQDAPSSFIDTVMLMLREDEARKKAS